MAGTTDSTFTVMQWIMDFFLHRNWNIFNKKHDMPEEDKDIFQGLFGILKNAAMIQAKESVNQKWLFMLILCRLSDGEDVNLQYEVGSEETPLEGLISAFKELVDIQETTLKTEGETLISDIKAEAVLACCRAGSFDRAKHLLSTDWKVKDLDHKEKQTRTILKTIVEAENTQDETLQSFTYNQFVGVMKKYLTKIFKRFPKPLLLEAAEKKLASEKSLGAAQNGRKRRLLDINFTADTIKKSQKVGSLETSPGGPNRAKLTKLWAENVNKIFEPSTSSEPEEIMPPPISPAPRKKLFKNTVNKDKRPSTDGNEKLSTSCSKEETTTARVSGDMTYKKNVGRLNRHEPKQTNREENKSKIDFDVESLNSSNWSRSTNRVRWTESEMEDFFDAVQKFGPGNWRQIADYLSTDRTNVMLKDKWRTMLKTGDARRLAKAKGKNMT